MLDMFMGLAGQKGSFEENYKKRKNNRERIDEETSYLQALAKIILIKRRIILGLFTFMNGL